MGEAQPPIMVGDLDVPEAEIVVEPWIFRAACALRDLDVEGFITFSLIVDLGFDTYRKIDCMFATISVVEGKAKLVEEFASNWAVNGAPNPLHVRTIKRSGASINKYGEPLWVVDVERTMLDVDTLKAIGRESLADALVEQGLCRA